MCLQHAPLQAGYQIALLMRCHAAQARVQAIHPGVDGVFPYLLYSDGACVRLGGHTFHVLNIISAAGSIGEARSRQGYARIALLPKVTRKHLGLPKKLSSADQERCAPPIQPVIPSQLALHMSCIGDLHPSIIVLGEDDDQSALERLRDALNETK